jgi:hypothetical protein
MQRGPRPTLVATPAQIGVGSIRVICMQLRQQQLLRRRPGPVEPGSGLREAQRGQESSKEVKRTRGRAQRQGRGWRRTSKGSMGEEAGSRARTRRDTGLVDRRSSPRDTATCSKDWYTAVHTRAPRTKKFVVLITRMIRLMRKFFPVAGFTRKWRGAVLEGVGSESGFIPPRAVVTIDDLAVTRPLAGLWEPACGSQPASH